MPLTERSGMLNIDFTKPAPPEGGAVALLLAEEDVPQGVPEALEKATGQAIGRGLAAADFKGRKGQSCTLLAPGGGLAKLVAVGLGKRAELDSMALEAAGG